jgi:hypothetical protein
MHCFFCIPVQNSRVFEPCEGDMLGGQQYIQCSTITIHPYYGVKSMFVSIKSRLTSKENLKDSHAILELAILKSKNNELFGYQDADAILY